MKVPTFRVRLWGLMVAVGVVAVVTAWARRQNLAELDRVARESARLDDRLWSRQSKRLLQRAELHARKAAAYRGADEAARKSQQETARLREASAMTHETLADAVERDDPARAKQYREQAARLREQIKPSVPKFADLVEYHSRLEWKYKSAAGIPQVPVEPDPPPPK